MVIRSFQSTASIPLVKAGHTRAEGTITLVDEFFDSAKDLIVDSFIERHFRIFYFLLQTIENILCQVVAKHISKAEEIWWFELRNIYGKKWAKSCYRRRP